MNQQQIFFNQMVLLLTGPISVISPHSLTLCLLLLTSSAWFSYHKEIILSLSNLSLKNLTSSYKNFVLIGILWLWSLYTVIWTPHPLEALLLTLKLLGLIISGWSWWQLILRTPDNIVASYINYLAAGVIFTVFAVILFDKVWLDFKKVTSFTTAFAYFSILTALSWWLLISANLWQIIPKKWFFLCKFFVTLIIFYGLHKAECDAGLYGLIAGLIAALGAKIYRNFFVKLMTSGVIISFLIFPLLFINIFNNYNISKLNQNFQEISYVHRLYIWHSNVVESLKKPLLGYGLNSSRYRYEQIPVQDLYLKTKEGYYVRARAPETCLHPHNIAIQWLYELGLVGLLLGIALCYQILSSINTESKLLPVKIGFYTTAQFIAWTNLGCWQNWWLAVLLILSIILSRIDSTLYTEKINNY